MVRLARWTNRAYALPSSIIQKEIFFMAKQNKSKKSDDAPQGVMGYLKRVVAGKPKAARASTPKPKARREKTTARPKAPSAPASQKNAPAPKKNAPVPPKGAPPKSDAAQSVKRKPPSITITRPEVTRPPLAQMPTPKNEPPIGAPNILLPKGGSTVASLTPSLRWMYVGGATRYEIEWSHDNLFGRGHRSALISAQTAITLDDAHALKSGTAYQWRVRGGNDSGWGPWSNAESFRAPDKL